MRRSRACPLFRSRTVTIIIIVIIIIKIVIIIIIIIVIIIIFTLGSINSTYAGGVEQMTQTSNST